jgi:ferredoxin/flavodoxin---NADP+ reductase
VLLCGNPAMVSEMQALLLAQGLKKHRRREPGQVTVETYWN